MYQCICPQVHLSEFIVCCRVQNNALGYFKCHIPIRRAGMIMADKSIGRSQWGDNYKVRRIWMTYYKVSHIYWNARPLSSGDKSSKKCRLKNGRPLPTMRWSPQTIAWWWGRVSSCAGPDHPHAPSLHLEWRVQIVTKHWDSPSQPVSPCP